jgi:heptosyltransferase I
MVSMRIAIVKLSALGDIVHAMVVLQFIKSFNEKILIDWVADEAYKDLLNSCPDINKVHITKIKKSKKYISVSLLINELIKVRKLGPYDIVIDMQGLIKSSIISKLIPSKKTVGFDKNSARERFAALFYSDKFNCEYSKNIIERNTELVGFAVGINIDKKQIHQKVPFLIPRSNKLDIRFSNSKKNILLIPGASHISKCYPSSKFAELANLLDANFFVIWGNKEEKIMANEIKELSNKVNVCEKMQLVHLLWFISKVDLVIGADTGPTHIAWAMNIPSITLFGPTPGYRNTFKTMINRVIESDSKVNPHSIDKCDMSIMDIEAHEISKVTNELLF